ncbi:hypothetical protein [Flagellimonas sp.]|uniref:hypothetical protein n=1 Tax=Flagellimonas sp. TaxID=2058762 RepID=UPI003B517A85
MKKLIILGMLLVGTTVFTQEPLDTENLFVRVFDMQGTKIAKGFVVSWSPNGLVLLKGKKTTEIPFNNIEKIKLKRAGGHNVGMGALFGAATGAVFGLALGEEEGFFVTSTSENMVGFSIVGAFLGSVIGGVSTVAKKNRTIVIDGDIKNWEQLVNQ